MFALLAAAHTAPLCVLPAAQIRTAATGRETKAGRACLEFLGASRVLPRGAGRGGRGGQGGDANSVFFCLRPSRRILFPFHPVETKSSATMRPKVRLKAQAS